MPDINRATAALPGLAAELPLRHRPIAAELSDAGGSCLIAIRDESVTYLTGYTTMTWKMYSRPIVAVLTSGGHLTVVVAETEADSARQRIPGAEVRTYIELDAVDDRAGLPDGRIQFAPHAARVLAEAVEEAGTGEVWVDGLDAAWPPVGQLTRLIPGLHHNAKDASPVIWRARLRKSPWELERMRAAAEVLDRAYETLHQRLRPGLTEREIARRFATAQLEAGADEAGPLAVVAGVDRGLFGFPTDRRWERDQLLYVDGAAILDGYWSDFCRTFAARPPTSTEQSGYSRTYAGLQAAMDLDPDGQTAASLGTAMATAMGIAPDQVGFGRFGHGIGIHVPEPPSLHPADSTELEAGMTLCIEPSVSHAGLNFVVEEEHVVRADGLSRLSPAAPAQILTV